jgi:hypothetical protein
MLKAITARFLSISANIPAVFRIISKKASRKMRRMRFSGIAMRIYVN